VSEHLFLVIKGTPAPQGSKTRTRYGMYDDNAKTLHPWRAAVTAQARALVKPAPPLTGPLAVGLDVILPRPKYHYRTGRNAHLLRDNAPDLPTSRGSGDVDKYTRAIFDALSDAGIWHDDVQVVSVTAGKTYPRPGGRLAEPGAVIAIHTLGGGS